MANNGRSSDRWALVDLSGQNGGGKLEVKVAGAILPVSQFSMTYGLNAMPIATAMVAMGRDARTGAISGVNLVASSLQEMAPAEVTLSGNLGDWNTTGGPQGKKQWPQGEHVLFFGYVGGTAYRRSNGRVYLVLNLVSQLVDLSMASCGSKDVVPGAPQSLLLPTLVRGAGADAYADIGSKFIRQLPEDIPVDFSLGILKAMRAVASDNLLQTSKLWCAGDSATDEKASNARALQALDGIGKWQGIRNGAGTDKYSEAYPLQVHSSGNAHVARGLGTIIGQSLAGTSMWSMLIGSLLPHFGMGIVPVSDRAYLCPVLPMAREAFMEISPDEYVDFDQKALSQRPMFGVGVPSYYNMATLSKGADPKVCVGGAFTAKAVVTKDGKPDGMWDIAPAPFWLEGWVHTDPEAGTGGGSAVEVALSKPTHSVDGTPPTAEKALNRDVGAEAEAWTSMMDLYAQMVYSANALKGRDGVLTGKLRMDIGPGTTVKIKAKGDFLSAGVDAMAVDAFAFVSSVSLIMDAEEGAANTTFQVTNIRTADENKSDRFSMTTHPFFPAYFRGSPLVNSLKVP